jgi:GNAT superfamily N-acetyltransferase
VTTVRRATVDDARAIAEVHVETWRAAYGHIFPREVLDGLSVDERERLWRASVPERDTAVFVAEREDEGETVGFASAGASRDEDAPGVGELYAIYVAPAAWGSGAGQALMAAAVAWLAERYSEAILWVATDNPRARRFYEKEGWVVDGTRTDVLRGVQVPETRYRLSGLRNPL